MRADACVLKRGARQSVRAWGSPPPLRRERGAKAPKTPEDEIPVAQEGVRGGAEVEVEVEPIPEEMEE